MPACVSSTDGVSNQHANGAEHDAASAALGHSTWVACEASRLQQPVTVQSRPISAAVIEIYLCGAVDTHGAWSLARSMVSRAVQRGCNAGRCAL